MARNSGGGRPRRRRPAATGLAAVAIAGVLALVLAACTSGPPPAPRYTLKILASSELADMKPILEQAARATGVTIDMTPVGSLTGAQEVIDGSAAQRGFGAVWFASDDYLDLYRDGLRSLNGTTEIMASPVVLAVRASAARRLGWDHGQVTWAAIARAAAEHRFTFGMTNPAQSNSGLSGLVATATAIAGQGAALQSGEIPDAVPALAGLFHAQDLTAPTSGPLLAKYLAALRNPGRAAPPDGLIDYESQLLTLGGEAPRDDPVTLVYPSDGVREATYPLSVLASAPPAARAAYQRLAVYLTSAPVQRQIMDTTHRRPIDDAVPLAPPLAGHQPVQLPFPAAAGTVRKLIQSYDGQLRTAGRAVYVLDVSGSMRGAPLAGLKRALLALTGTGDSLPAALAQFRAGEEVDFLPFGSTPGPAAIYQLAPSGNSSVLARMRGYIDGLRVHGHTALYDALVTAYQLLRRQDAAAPGRISSIVLLTDGGNNAGRTSLDQFLSYYEKLPAGSPPVYTIAFGNADLGPLAKVASVTGGASFDAVGQPPDALTAIFQEIRGYQ